MFSHSFLSTAFSSSYLTGENTSDFCCHACDGEPVEPAVSFASNHKFKDGAERKEWVLAMLKASADGINYDIDYDAIADMIDSLCDMSKVINPATPANKVTVKKEEGK